MSAASVRAGCQAAPFPEDDELIDGRYQSMVDRCEAAPLLAGRQLDREELPFVDTEVLAVEVEPDFDANDDDAAWQSPDKASPIALTICCTSAALVLAGLGYALAQMARG